MAASVEIVGPSPIMDRLGSAVAAWGSTAMRALARSGAIVERAVKQQVSGIVLRVRTGWLRSSIQAGAPYEAGGGVYEVRVGSSVVHARIHEYGGTIRGHTVSPVRARALAFDVHGERVFRMSAEIPSITMPKRAYLIPSLHAHLPEITAVVGGAFAALVGGQVEPGEA